MKQQRTHLLTLSLWLMTLHWILLLVWRKPYSYTKVGELYITELVILLAMFLFAVAVSNHKKISHIRQTSMIALLPICTTYFLTAIVVAVFDQEHILLILLIPFVYVFYIPLLYILYSNVHLVPLKKVCQLFMNSYLLLFFLYYAVKLPTQEFLKENILADVADAGWTFSFGVALSLSLFYDFGPRRYLNHLAVLLNGVGAILMFQRGVFFTTILAVFLLLFLTHRTFRWRSFTYALYLIILMGGALMILLPLAAIVFSESLAQELDSKVYFDFLLSIFFLDSGENLSAIGTRNHRLEMWASTLDYTKTNCSIWLGCGFSMAPGEAIGETIRVPHNGFVTIFFLTGLVGIVCILAILTILFWQARYFHNTKQPVGREPLYRNLSAFYTINLGCFLGDALTGTILDSPFTLFTFVLCIVLVQLALVRFLRAGHTQA